MNDTPQSTTRLPALEGGRNFRDLGGYRTSDGRQVRWGRLYRSGAMSYLTPADRTQLTLFGIRTVCDFRSSGERSREPTNWSSEAVESLHFDYDHSSVSLRGLLREAPELTAEVMHTSMTRLYRRLPSLLAAPYAALFAKLAQGAVPLVFHCAAGKDRTGIAAALVLLSLGVPRQTVMDDYVLTNTAVDLEAVLLARPRTSLGMGTERAHLSDLSREARAPLIEARLEYLEAALEQIELEHGSIGRYLQGPLGVSDSMLTQLRSHLLAG